MTRRTILSISAAIWCVPGPVQAMLLAPIPFAKLSKDESKILVIRNGGNGFSRSQVTNPRLTNGEKIDFLAVFPTSGVYDLATRRLEYRIDWFCLEWELLASDDLQHIARLNRFGSDWALKFYSRGVETSGYKLEELLTGFTAERYRPFTTADWHHSWHEGFEIRDGQVVVTTVEREVAGVPIGYRELHSFDLSTGALRKTEVRNGFPRILIGSFGLLVFGVASTLLAAWARRNESKQNKAEHRIAHPPHV